MPPGKTQIAVEIPRFEKDFKSAITVNHQKSVPEPAHGEVLVRATLRPINPSDIGSVRGFYAGFRPKRLPATPGLEGMGTVETLGPGVSKVKVGQRVVLWPSPKENGEGTWQQYVVLKEGSVVPVAANISDEDAAQFIVNPVTAYCFVEMVPKGKWLLHNAANSILGKELIAMAKHCGVKTLNLVRRQEAAEELRQLGADVVLDISDSSLSLTEKIWEITGGEGIWAAFNPVSGPINQAIMKGLKDGGICYIYGVVGGRTVLSVLAFPVVSMQSAYREVPMPDLLYRNVACKGFWLTPYLASIPLEEKERILNTVMDMLSKRIFKPDPPSKVFPLSEIAEAIEAYFEFAGKGGKILLKG